jgi:hypothetical protein
MQKSQRDLKKQRYNPPAMVEYGQVLTLTQGDS